DSDLRSALLLEAGRPLLPAHAVPGAHVRKFAFHLILAGHRFSKAAQRAHSLRCYRPLLASTRDRGWDTGEDHINLPQSPASSPTFPRDFVHVYREFIPTVASPPDYCLIGGPCLCCLCRRRALPGRRPVHPEWSGLERALLEAATGRSAPPIVSAKPAMSVAEHAEREIAQYPILRDVCLLWSLRRTNGGGGETPADANAAAAVGLVTNEIEASQMHFARVHKEDDCRL
uniref:CBF domain-containing protein n=1 Tax=Macrostomum lignano TaxID=282301 RepID=A0A1I8FKJ6_9PLAT